MIPWKAAILFALVASYTPGPNNIMAMNGARRFGLRRSLPFFVGMASGLVMVMTMSGAFNLILKTLVPKVQPVLGMLGALYLLYLAFRPFLRRSAGGAREPERSYSLLQGVLLQLVNPKVLLYSLTLMSSFIVPWSDSLPLILMVSAAAGVVGFGSLLLWGLFGTLFQRYLSRYEVEVDAVMAVLLLYCAWTISGLGPLFP